MTDFTETASPGRPTQAENARAVTGQFFDDVIIREDRTQLYEVFSGEHNSYPAGENQLPVDETVWRLNGPLGGVKLLIHDHPIDLEHVRDFHPEHLEESIGQRQRSFNILLHRDHPWATTQEPDRDGRYWRELENGDGFHFGQFITFDAVNDGIRVYALLQSLYRLHISEPVVEDNEPWSEGGES